MKQVLHGYLTGEVHSSAADGCLAVGEVVGEIVKRDRVVAALEATADFLRAFERLVAVLREDPADVREAMTGLRSVLLKWTTLADPSELGDFDACTVDNDYCDSPWLESARIGPATPVLPCATREGRTAPWVTVAWVVAAAGAFTRRGARRRIRR